MSAVPSRTFKTLTEAMTDIDASSSADPVYVQNLNRNVQFVGVLDSANDDGVAVSTHGHVTVPGMMTQTDSSSGNAYNMIGIETTADPIRDAYTGWPSSEERQQELGRQIYAPPLAYVDDSVRARMQTRPAVPEFETLPDGQRRPIAVKLLEQGEWGCIKLDEPKKPANGHMYNLGGQVDKKEVDQHMQDESLDQELDKHFEVRDIFATVTKYMRPGQRTMDVMARARPTAAQLDKFDRVIELAAIQFIESESILEAKQTVLNTTPLPTLEQKLVTETLPIMEATKHPHDAKKQQDMLWYARENTLDVPLSVLTKIKPYSNTAIQLNPALKDEDHGIWNELDDLHRAIWLQIMHAQHDLGTSYKAVLQEELDRGNLPVMEWYLTCFRQLSSPTSSFERRGMISHWDARTQDTLAALAVRACLMGSKPVFKWACTSALSWTARTKACMALLESPVRDTLEQDKAFWFLVEHRIMEVRVSQNGEYTPEASLTPARGRDIINFMGDKMSKVFPMSVFPRLVRFMAGINMDIPRIAHMFQDLIKKVGIDGPRREELPGLLMPLFGKPGRLADALKACMDVYTQALTGKITGPNPVPPAPVVDAPAEIPVTVTNVFCNCRYPNDALCRVCDPGSDEEL
jgi:hypothetical protein